MQALSGFVSIVFYKLFFMSLTATVIGMVALLFRTMSYRKISPDWQCVVWAFVIIALLVPFRPKSSISLAGAIETFQDISFRDDYQQSQQQYQSLLETQYEAFKTTQTGAEHNALYYRYILVDIIVPLVWLVGVFLIFMFIFLSGRRLRKRLKSSQAVSDMERVRRILAVCKEQLSVRKDIGVVVQDYIKSPALYGVFTPMIVLPSYVDEMNDQSIQYILMHELSHFKRFDIMVNYLMLFIQALYWFNPLIWVLFEFIRQDIEHANDAYVLRVIGDSQAEGYNYTLVEILGKAGGIPFSPKFLCMVNNKNDMARRIQIIKNVHVVKKNRLFAAIASLVLVFSLSLFFLTSPSEASADDLARDDRLVGNWIWDDINDYSGMYTFYSDGTASYVERDNDNARAILSGSYTVIQNDDILRLKFSKSAGNDIYAEPYFIENTISYSFSPDGQLILRSDDYSWILHKTTKPSMLQISSGLWEGRRVDGSKVSVLISLDNMVSVRIEKDNILTHFYGGFYWLYSGWMQMNLIQDYEAWERYLEDTEKNREIMKNNASSGLQREIPNIPVLPPFEISHRQDITISRGGNKLLLPDFMGFPGDMQELVLVK